MRKFFCGLCSCLLAFAVCACQTGSQQPAASAAGTPDAAAQPESEQLPQQSEPEETSNRRISVQFGENTVVYQLNQGTAADSLYEQLPLTLEVEDYSTNEKIFYPPEELDTADSPLAQAGAGTLAYYAPRGDVVMFYQSYSQNPSLYELGQAVSGGELVSQMSGTVTITAIE